MDTFAEHVANELDREPLAAITDLDRRTLDTALRARGFAHRERIELLLCRALTARDEGDHYAAGEHASKAVGIARVWTGETDVPAWVQAWACS